MTIITLPWTAPVLFPNAQRKKHWATRADAARDQRAYAKILTMKMNKDSLATPCRVTYTFCKPDQRVRDLNGCYGAMKAAEDGIADALQIDDRHFYPVTLAWGDVVKGGLVIVKIGE